MATEIQPGERIVWLEQPVPHLYARQAWPTAVGGVFFTAFALFWTIAAATGITRHGVADFHWASLLFPLWGVPFILCGLGMLTSPYWYRRAARRTVYAITDRRAVVWEAKPMKKDQVHSFGRDRLVSMTRNRRADGSGDLVFEKFEEPCGSGTITIRRGFIGIERLDEVEDLLRSTLLA